MSIKKEKRLKSIVAIEHLFKKGSPVFVYPVRAVLVQAEPTDAEPFKAAFSVSKRLFKKAVDRNRVKRIMREAFRHHMHILNDYALDNKQLHIMFIYIGKEIHPYDLVAQSMKRLLKKIMPR
jgi:ribonuclease P protein component